MNTYKILIVEDSRAWAKQMMYEFKKLGLYYEWARDGEEAVNSIRNNKEDYIAIIMDFKMPRLQGVPATRQIRKLGFEKPIIGHTSVYGEENMREARKAGMNICLSKKLNLDHLIEALYDFDIIVKKF